MTEDEQKKESGVSVRVPEWLLDQVESLLKRLPRPRPTRGALIAKAWEASGIADSNPLALSGHGKTINFDDSSKINVGKEGSRIDGEASEHLHLTPEGSRNTTSTNPQGAEWAEKWAMHPEQHGLLHEIMEFGPDGMPEDISGNLRWFGQCARLLNDASAGNAPAAGGSAAERLERARNVKQKHLGGKGDTAKPDRRKGSKKADTA